MPKKAKFLDEILVTEEMDGETPFLAIQDAGLDGINEEQEVAVYKLDRVYRLKIEKTLTD